MEQYRINLTDGIHRLEDGTELVVADGAIVYEIHHTEEAMEDYIPDEDIDWTYCF